MLSGAVKMDKERTLKGQSQYRQGSHIIFIMRDIMGHYPNILAMAQTNTVFCHNLLPHSAGCSRMPDRITYPV